MSASCLINYLSILQCHVCIPRLTCVWQYFGTLICEVLLEIIRSYWTIFFFNMSCPYNDLVICKDSNDCLMYTMFLYTNVMFFNDSVRSTHP